MPVLAKHRVLTRGWDNPKGILHVLRVSYAIALRSPKVFVISVLSPRSPRRTPSNQSAPETKQSIAVIYWSLFLSGGERWGGVAGAANYRCHFLNLRQVALHFAPTVPKSVIRAGMERPLESSHTVL